ncbi:condensation domain-containing protein, partial [Pseudomonas cedrina]
PSYMVPSLIFTLESMPLNISNKTDRILLSRRQDTQIVRYEPAQMSGITENLAVIWRMILCLDNVHLDGDFFDLGGHSLLAIKLANHVLKTFKIKLPIAQIFSLRTLQHIGAYLEQFSEGGGAEEVNLRSATQSEMIPLSFAQERLWLLEQLTPGVASYNIPLILKFDGELDVQRLRACFSALSKRHEILRTAIRMVDDQLVQHIAEPFEIPMKVSSMEHLCAEERALETSSLIEREAKKPFILSDVPLFRLHLIRHSDERHILVVNLHHMIFDGLSTQLFLTQLRDSYEAYGSGSQPTSLNPGAQYADFALWQRRWIDSGESSTQLAFWKKHLKNVSPGLNMPLDFKRPQSAAYHGMIETFELPVELVIPLQKVCKEKQLTMFMLLYAAFNILLSQWTGDRDILVGTPVTNRTREEFEESIGLYVNTILLRTVVDEGMTYEQYFKLIMSNVSSAFDNADLPFNVLVQALNPVRLPGCSPLSQTMFGFQSREPEISHIADLDVEVSYQGGDVARFDLVFNTFMSAGRLHGYVEYKKSLFLSSTIQSLIQKFQHVLVTLINANFSVDQILNDASTPSELVKLSE